MIKNNKRYLLALFVAVVSIQACSNDDDKLPVPEPEPEEPEFLQISDHIKRYRNGVIEISNYLVDTTKSNANAYDFYSIKDTSFVTDDKNAELVKTDAWDFCFQGLWRQQLYPNNGKMQTQSRPWYGNSTNALITMVKTSFDDLTTVPSDIKFPELTDGYYPQNYVIPDVPDNNYQIYWASRSYTEAGDFAYFIPLIDRCYIFKLDDGRYVKFQFVNIYNNAPEENTISSKRGYVSFRYFVSEKGSLDLSTK
ncbi:hypothetical protein SAMN05216436_10169 [bacterium A37T11]|nr:hypothetical protein SAMN05216436_10169 [bacterium A37T11]